MALREDIVESAVKFLLNPNVSASPVEQRVAFLRSKNLTQEEVDAALARAGSAPQSNNQQEAAVTPLPNQPNFSTQQYAPYQQPPPYGWPQQQAPPVPRRDWRDWFIMATVVGGVGFGLYTLTQRYIVPLIAPPTPEKLQQDKQQIDQNFERAFALIEQLTSDTAELKNSEQARTERLDKALEELESVISDLKVANRRREGDTQRVIGDVQSLKDAIPRAMDAQKELTESRLKELGQEMRSLNTLMTQRLAGSTMPAAGMRLASGVVPSENKSSGSTTMSNGVKPLEEPVAATSNPSTTNWTGTPSGGRLSPLAGQGSAAGPRAAIPAWQLAHSASSGSSPATSANRTPAPQSTPKPEDKPQASGTSPSGFQ